MTAHAERILIIDFGSQVTQLIARRVREAGVYCEIKPFNALGDGLTAPGLKGIILSGGPASVGDEGSPRAPQQVFELGVPVLGICYGQMCMVTQLGGVAAGSSEREFGRAFVTMKASSPLFEGMAGPGEEEEVWMSHGDRVTELPPNFEVIGSSPNAPFAAFASVSQGFYGVMFHPEVVHTPRGATLLTNFVRGIAGCSGEWTMAAYKDEAIAAIREQVGPEGRVICGLSGGVDSSVAAVLIHEAIGDRLTCVFVDTGMMRHGEAEEVVTMFRETYNIKLIHRDASDLFINALEGVEDPELKRKTIGRLFIDVFDEAATESGGGPA